MIYNFDQIKDRRATESVKWRAYPEDVLPLWVADMDFPSAQPVIRVLQERVVHGVFGYPTVEALRLRQLVVERMADRYAWCINPQDVLFLPGVITGFNLACHAVAVPDGGVLVQTPIYTPILNAAKTTGCQPQETELVLCLDGTYSIDMDAFSAAITDHTKLFILCNPHNPVGRVYQPGELARLAQICLMKGVVICADEIHSDLIFSDHRHTPIASLDPEIAQNTITVLAPSKTFNIAGLNCSIVIVQNPQLREKYLAAQKGLVSGVNLMGLIAAQAAYADGQEWLDQLLEYLESNRDILFDFVRAELPGVTMTAPEGTYLAWLDCRQAGIEGNPYEFFLKEAHVALSDGEIFGQGGQGFVRLNFGCPQGILLQALEQMKQALLSRPS